MLGERATLTCRCGCLLVPTLVSLTEVVVVSWSCPGCGCTYYWSGYIRLDQVVEALGNFIEGGE